MNRETVPWSWQTGGPFTVASDSGTFRFRLKAAHGEIIASSEAYTSKAAAQSGIESVKTNAAGATVDDQT
jgi:uncharacterized protein YegP (UPF0339 family)